MPRTYKPGEKPGKGTYECTSCNDWRVRLDDPDDALPPCGNCPKGKDIRYRKVA